MLALVVLEGRGAQDNGEEDDKGTHLECVSGRLMVEMRICEW